MRPKFAEKRLANKDKLGSFILVLQGTHQVDSLRRKSTLVLQWTPQVDSIFIMGLTFSQVVWLIGCWLVSDSHKWIHKLRKKEKKSSVLLRKEIMNKLVVDLLQQKGIGLLKNYQKRSSSPGHWLHTRKPSSSHAAASTFIERARKRSLLTLRITCLDKSRWRYHGTQ